MMRYGFILILPALLTGILVPSAVLSLYGLRSR